MKQRRNVRASSYVGKSIYIRARPGNGGRWDSRRWSFAERRREETSGDWRILGKARPSARCGGSMEWTESTEEALERRETMG